MVLTWLVWVGEERLNGKIRYGERAIYLFTALFTLASFLFFAFVPLPRAYYPELFFGRPEEFIPALFFGIALAGHLRKGHWKNNAFEHWLVLSLIVGLVGQTIFMSFSTELFDFQFDAAHLLKKVSYVCVLIGLLVSMSTIFKKERSATKALNEALERSEETLHELELSNKELDSFAYSVSHDLRAPLRAIDGFTSILMEEYVAKLDDEGKRLGDTIQRNTRKMGQLIDDLLAFSRTGRSAMHYSNIDMKNMVNAIYHERSTPEDRERVKFSIEDLPDAVGDTTLLRQVWGNLISNALKFSSHRKQPVITISCNEVDNKLNYCIKDNGAGFDMNYKDKLFGVFQRLHSEKEFTGTGVGLALVQRIIHRHGGEVWGEGKVNEGATFYFSLQKNDE